MAKIEKHIKKSYNDTYDKKYPFKNKWFKLRYRARKRGIEFTITYEEFRDFCIDNDLEGKTGRNKEDLTLDRIHSHKGYSLDNLQVLTLSENSRKGVLPPNEELPDWFINRPTTPPPF